MKPQHQYPVATAPKGAFEAALFPAATSGPHLRNNAVPRLFQTSQLETWKQLNMISAPSQTSPSPSMQLPDLGPGVTSVAQSSQQQQPRPDTVLELSPRGKHSYPRATPWSCNHIAGWGGLIIACVTLVFVCILYFPGRDHLHSDSDISRIDRDAPHENYVGFRFESEIGPTRWPKTGVIAGLVLEDIVSTRLCCVVGSQQYLVCDSSQGLTSNLGISYIVRNLVGEHGAHLLITAPSTDMNGAQCIFSWQVRLREHDKGALVVAKGEPAKIAAKSWFAHSHRGRGSGSGQ